MNSKIEAEAIEVLAEGRIEEAVTLWGASISESVRQMCSGTKTPLYILSKLFEGRLRFKALSSSTNEYRRLADRLQSWTGNLVCTEDWVERDPEELLALPALMEVGHKSIDSDHGQLFVFANRIRETLNVEDFAKTAAVIKEYTEETKEHFIREEDILFEVGHPLAEIHSAYHRMLLDKADDLIPLCEYMIGGKVTRNALYQTLVSFLLVDPISADMELRPFFLEQS